MQERSQMAGRLINVVLGLDLDRGKNSDDLGFRLRVALATEIEKGKGGF